MSNHSDGYLIVKGNQYSLIASYLPEIIEAEQRQGREPLIVVETEGSVVVVAEQDFNPMLAKVIKAHLGGKWVMIAEPDEKLVGRQIGPELEQRLKDVMEVLPIGWGEQPRKAEELRITTRELAWALAELDERGLVYRPKQGTWVKKPVALGEE